MGQYVAVIFYSVLTVIKVSICLQVVNLSVPTLKQRGDSATLTCEYDLEGGRLYSVKWYRDNEEFYRYMPLLRPPQHAHKLDGIRVEMDKSNARRVHLRDLTLKSRGLYRCEVSEEAPSFNSAQAEEFMEIYLAKVATGGLDKAAPWGPQARGAPRTNLDYDKSGVDFPRESPRISGHERHYNIDELLSVNCSSAKSFPAPVLQWLVDGQRITDESALLPYEVKPAPQGLLVATLGLRIPVKARMKLKCIAMIGTHRRERTITVELKSSSPERQLDLVGMLILIISVKILS